MSPAPSSLICAFLIILVSTLTAQTDSVLRVSLVNQSVLESRLNAGLVPNNQREEAIATLFRQAGCEVELQPVARHADNVICTLPGRDPSRVIVGAHFDFIEKGQGIVDDWSGVALLVSLYQTLKHDPRQHTFTFIAFAKEEDGLIGSSKYVRSLNKEHRAALRAFVNLECLGTSPPKVWFHRATPELTGEVTAVASLLNIPFTGMDVDGVGDDDSHPFWDAHIHVITIHSITQQSWGYLHSKRDSLDKIQLSDYRDSYRLVAFFLVHLDSNAPTAVPATPSLGAPPP